MELGRATVDAELYPQERKNVIDDVLHGIAEVDPEGSYHAIRTKSGSIVFRKKCLH